MTPPVYRYIGFPEKPSNGEKILKTTLNVGLNQVVKSFRPVGDILDISEIQVSFKTNESGSVIKKNKESGGSEKTLKDDFLVQNPVYGLEDIILPKETKNQIVEAINTIKHEKLIFKDWGFEKLEPFHKVALNFFGPPGTGKTMCAHGVASLLNKKILSIDYAQIESKFVGDAPKNLMAAFDKAKEENALLFFDEADSVLGKRIGAVTTGSEQAINSLRSQMLIALDQYSGIIIFASNFIQNYDKAFETRIRHIEFTLPDIPTIISMLSKMLPQSAPFKNIDIKHIAEKCEGLSGRDLKNILVLSAVRAANNKQNVISNDDVFYSIDTIKSSLESFSDLGLIKNNIVRSITSRST